MANIAQTVNGIANPHADTAVDATLLLEGIVETSASATVLTGDAIDAHNTFEKPDQVRPVALKVESENGSVSVELPPRSVSVITVRE